MGDTRPTLSNSASFQASPCRLAANIFVVAASLLLGLMLNSAKNTFEAVDRNIHAFATDLILLDRSLRQYRPEASDACERLAAYLRQAAKGTWASTAHRYSTIARRSLLDGVANALANLTPADPVHVDLACAATSTLGAWSGGAGY